MSDTVPDLLVGLSGEAEVYAYMMSTPGSEVETGHLSLCHGCTLYVYGEN